jgi:formate dehydrogenase maturation protein FdhE
MMLVRIKCDHCKLDKRINIGPLKEDDNPEYTSIPKYCPKCGRSDLKSKIELFVD